MVVEAQVELRLSGAPEADLKDLSAVYRDGRSLWLAGDEQPRFERLRLAPDEEAYGERASFALGDFVDLPEGDDVEVDTEGLDRQGDYLWLVGSHSRTRKRVDEDRVDDRAADDLATVEEHPNRRVLIRIALVRDGDDVVPVRSATTSTGETVTSALLSEELVTALREDRHLAGFLDLPSKDNGLDVEGLSALGDSLLLGLRGPVLRGWAVVLEVAPEPDPTDPSRLVLGSPPYRKHFLQLGGLGVRDLCRSGDDILLLAGPTMDLDGPVRVFRWHDAAHARDVEVVPGSRVSLAAEVPFGDGKDHAEGLTLLPSAHPGSRALVVYDSPARARRPAPGVVLADVLRLAAR